jgi:hypothetical protein
MRETWLAIGAGAEVRPLGPAPETECSINEFVY